LGRILKLSIDKEILDQAWNQLIYMQGPIRVGRNWKSQGPIRVGSNWKSQRPIGVGRGWRKQVGGNRGQLERRAFNALIELGEFHYEFGAEVSDHNGGPIDSLGPPNSPSYELSLSRGDLTTPWW